MKKINVLRMIWLIGVYIILFIILFLVIQYKVKWESRDYSTYLYFYDCQDSNLCTTTSKITSTYSKIKCSDFNTCPYIKDIKDNLVIMVDTNTEYLYDYVEGKIINDKYTSYAFNGDYYIVGDGAGKYGIIDEVGEIIAEVKYDEITDYKDGYIVYRLDGKKGIINEKKEISIQPTYEDIILINDNMYAYLEDNKYYIAAYNTELPVNNNNYDYVYGINNNAIFILRDKKIDIVDNSLKSVLLMKVDTYYNYETEKERASLKITKENNMFRFNVVLEDNKVIPYIYDIKNRKLYS